MTRLLPLILTLAGCAAPTDPPAEPGPASRPASRPAAKPARHISAREAARAYGLDRFGQVKALSFTFNVQRPDGKASARQWRWEPASQTVTLGRGPDAITFTQGQPTEAQREADARFVNDQFWLLFPFHLVWDDVAIQHKWKQPLPIGEGTGERLVVTYPKVGGYTPGDVYEVFLDEQRRLVAWTFRRGGQSPGRPFTWEQHHTVGPLLLSLSHHDAARTLRVFFTDVVVETHAGETFRASAK